MRFTITPALIFLLGCHDSLSGPQALQIAAALSDPWADSSAARLATLRVWLAGLPFRPDANNPGGPLRLVIDGEPTPARGLVFELVLENQGPLPEDCAGGRFTVLGWSLGEPSVGVIVAGGNFRERLGGLTPCEGYPQLSSQRPIGILRPLRGEPYPAWTARDGEASVILLTRSQGCPFISPDGVAFLASTGIRCSGGTFEVAAAATLREAAQPSAPGTERHVLIARTVLPGVRWTVDCKRPPYPWTLRCGRGGS